MFEPTPHPGPTGGPITTPDALPNEAWQAIDLIEGEAVLRAWRTPRGFLVLTNLRCLGLHEQLRILGPVAWGPGPEFFFYNLRPPTVLFGRFVQLSEEVEELGSVGRFAVRDPEAVARAIADALAAGRLAWSARRQRTQELIRARAEARARRAAGEPNPEVMVRCSYCGNLANAALRRCPSCGARLG